MSELLIIYYRYAREDATEGEVREAAARANALGFIEKNEFGIF